MKNSKDIAYGLFTVTAAVAILLVVTFILLRDNEIQLPSPTKIYYVDNISAAHQKVIDLFNQENANAIEVVPVNLPFSKFTTNERKEILTRALRSGGKRIDVFAVDLIWVSRFAKWSYPLQFYSDQLHLEHIKSRAMESCFSENRLVAMPLYLDIGLLYYRKDLVRALPGGRELERRIHNSLSWDEFIGLRDRFDTRKNPFFLFAGDKFEGMVCSFHELLSREVSNQIFSSPKINLDVPEARHGLQMMVDFIYKYRMTPPDVTAFDEYKSYIYSLRNNAVFLRGWPGFHKHYKNIIPDTTVIDNFAIAPLPHFAGNTSAAVFGGWNLMISKYSDHTTESLKFIRFTLQKNIQQLLYDMGGYIPVNKEVYSDSLYMQQHPELAYYKNIIKWGKHRPYRKDYTKISDIMSYYMNRALKKQIGVREALQLASQKINSQSAFIK